MELRIETEEDTGFLQELGKIIRQLVGKSADAQISAAKASASAIRRSLMGFDKLNRLTAQSGKGSGKSKDSIATFIAALKDENKLKNLSEPMAAVARVLRGFGAEIKSSEEQLQSLKQRIGELPLTMQQMIGSTGDLCKQLLGLPTAAEQAAHAMNRVDESTMFTAGLMEILPDSALKAAAGLEQSFYGTAAFFKKQVSEPLKTAFSTMFADLPPAAQEAMGGTKQIFSNGAASISATFRAAWEQVLSVFSKTDDTLGGVVGGVVSSMKSVINRLIGGINTAIVEPFTGINNAFTKLKTFTVNGLQPFKNLNFSVSMPKIPMLASGAVLPANKPFLAMVGDQKHGTNIEAPLATIEQAVAQVMEGVVEAEMAGHNQTVQVLRQILEAVLGIRLDEDALGRAAQRYSARQAIMTGGF